MFPSEEDLLASVEHIAFYLASDNAQGINSPKAWAMSNLLKGYYPAPAGFKSWATQQEESRLKDAEERLRQLREAQRKRFEVEFEIWAAELEPSRRRQLLQGTPFADNPAAKLARTVLRQTYAEEVGFELEE
jgi:hypothetical protein